MPESPAPLTADGDGGAPPRASVLARLRERDHTRGNLLSSVLVLSLPQVAMSALGFGLFQLVDLRFLSLLGDDAVAAAGAANQTLRQVFMLLILGLNVSTQMWIARLVGQGRVDAAEHVAGQSFLLGGGIALIGLVTCGLFPEFFVSLVARDPAVVELGAVYVRIVFVTLGLMVANQTFNGVLHGAGDATTPMIITFIVAPVSIVAEWALAFGRLGAPELGIAGIALGAALGGSCGIAVAAWALFSGRCRVHLRARHLVPDLQGLRDLLATAWQPALHMVARTLIVIFFMTLAGRLGGKVQAAYTIGLRVEMLAIMIAFPISNACATLVGQNLGAGNLRRAWRTLFVSAGVSAAALWPASLGLWWFRADLVGFFTSDPEVAALAVEYLGYSAAILLFYGFYFIGFRTLQAAGDMRSPMLISVGCAVLLGAPMGFYLSRFTDAGASGMWLANFVYAMVNCAITVAWLARGRWARLPQSAAESPA
ncbi:MAG: MATE family efflux transporter [Myxococcota bacterium]